MEDFTIVAIVLAGVSIACVLFLAWRLHRSMKDSEIVQQELLDAVDALEKRLQAQQVMTDEQFRILGKLNAANSKRIEDAFKRMGNMEIWTGLRRARGEL